MATTPPIAPVPGLTVQAIAAKNGKILAVNVHFISHGQVYVGRYDLRGAPVLEPGVAELLQLARFDVQDWDVLFARSIANGAVAYSLLDSSPAPFDPAGSEAARRAYAGGLH